jgi:hypothetical protein
MIRWLMWLLGGLVLGGIVHLATVLLLACLDCPGEQHQAPPSAHA